MLRKEIGLQDIPFDQFQRFLVEGDVSVCGGEENAKRLYEEYLEHTASSELKRAILVNNNIVYYSLKIKIIDTLLVALQEYYSEDIAKILRDDVGFFKYQLTKETYIEDIKKIIGECKRYKTKLREWEIEAQKLNKEDKKTDKLSYAYFEDVLIAIGEMEKMFIPSNISTLRYCRLYKKLVDNIEKPKVTNGNKQSR